jgi:hypothetical protein
VKLTSRVDGLAALNARLSAIADDAAFAPDLRDTAEDIRARALAGLADGVPPDSRSGALAQSLTAERAEDGSYTVGTPLDYGWHLEFGSLTRPPRPWLAPAAEDARPGFIARVASHIGAKVRRAVPIG